MANMLLRVFAVLCTASMFGVYAAVPDKNAILSQLRKDGACVSTNSLHDLNYSLLRTFLM
jgi:hypothetical protein